MYGVHTSLFVPNMTFESNHSLIRLTEYQWFPKISNISKKKKYPYILVLAAKQLVRF